MPVKIVTAEEFRARFSEFDGVPDARVYLELEEAEADVSESFGDLRRRAIAFLAAHRLATSVDESGALVPDQPGAITSATADGVSSSYAMPAGISGPDINLWSTQYGQRFLDLRNRITAGPIVAC